MKILYLEWDSYLNNYIKASLANKGFEIITFSMPSDENTRMSENLSKSIVMNALTNKVNFVFSLNYFPVAAIACMALKIKYISWTYDSPYIQLYSRTIEYPVNYAFIFDRSEYQKLVNLGIKTVYYLPMPSATEFYDQISIGEKEHQKYDADIAMIGSMYSEKKHRLVRHFNKIDDFTRGYIDSLLEVQKNIFGEDIIEKCLTKEIISNLQKSAPAHASGDGFETLGWTFSKYFLCRELTRIEREEYLNALSEHFKVTLYTHLPTPNLPRVNNKGPLDYYTEMPQAMKCAKINLNITLRSIVTGIPLRAMDILGCGGFLLTSYQSDMLEFFEPGIDFEYYDCQKTLIDVCEYYLSHDTERINIAQSGYQKAKKYHNIDSRIKSIIKIALEK